MPVNSVSSQGPLTVLKISDFTAGIYSYTNGESISRIPNNTGKITFSPNTYGVYGIPTGGLLLGPTPFAFRNPDISLPPEFENDNAGITGMIRIDGALNGDFLNVMTIQTQDDADGYIQSALYLFSATQDPGSPINYDSDTSPTFFGYIPSYVFATTMTDGTDYYIEIIYTQFYIDGASGSRYLAVRLFDSSEQYLTTSPGIVGIAMPGNGRVWVCGVGPLGPNIILNAINYTNPSIASLGDNHAIIEANTMIDYDDPSSFSAWGCVSSTNTLLVKSTNGGIVVSGDIYNPTISRAPSVQGTNGLIGNACQTPIGLVYRSYNRGVWVWNGGSTSQKISPTVADATFDNTEYLDFNTAFYIGPLYGTTPSTGAYGGTFNVDYICNMIFVDGGLFYDLQTGAWWRLPPYMNDSITTAAHGSPQYFLEVSHPTGEADGLGSFWTLWFATTTLNATYYSFDVSVPTMISDHYAITPPSGYYGSYLETNPIQLSDDTIVEVEELSLVMQGTGSLYVGIFGIDGEEYFITEQDVDVANFSRIRIIQHFQTDVVILRVGWTNSQNTGLASPLIESIEIKYRDTYPVPVA